MSKARSDPSRGEMIDIGGRRLRVVKDGPAGPRPTVVLEHGAFGCAADWAVVQARLAAKGLASLAYDRAGLGYSDPGPRHRDGHAMVADLDALLRALRETGPIVLVGHSMGGLTTRLFALTHPERVAGLVMVDAVTPEILAIPAAARAFDAFSRILTAVRWLARAGLMRPATLITGDTIGLPPEASAEKRAIQGSASHALWAAEEVRQWRALATQASAAALPPGLPVAAITAGARTLTALKETQAIAALACANGYIEQVPGAGHASLLGRRFADPVVRGVEHVLAAVQR
ncbi:alpha/beta hydrolase [Phenylobacterium sp.]|uniref:alpha/beta fold hydrolase n=1 Tax=Phenylobacterium sp. TaxID=1871053 RepID=UPI00286CC094|nr:alpha/beta hydrolase [Phenylobacterium sp.]